MKFALVFLSLLVATSIAHASVTLTCNSTVGGIVIDSGEDSLSLKGIPGIQLGKAFPGKTGLTTFKDLGGFDATLIGTDGPGPATLDIDAYISEVSASLMQKPEIGNETSLLVPVSKFVRLSHSSSDKFCRAFQRQDFKVKLQSVKLYVHFGDPEAQTFLLGQVATDLGEFTCSYENTPRGKDCDD